LLKWLSQARNDVVGGLVSAAVAIPLGMGYGMFAFSSLGENYFADGALAGLATALVVAIACVVLGDRTTTVYAPRVNSTFFLGILIYGLVHSHAPAITAGGIPFILGVTARVPSRAPVESVSPSPRDKDRERQPENRERELDIENPTEGRRRQLAAAITPVARRRR
jgi:hypothetical protein